MNNKVLRKIAGPPCPRLINRNASKRWPDFQPCGTPMLMNPFASYEEGDAFKCPACSYTGAATLPDIDQKLIDEGSVKLNGIALFGGNVQNALGPWRVDAVIYTAPVFQAKPEFTEFHFQFVYNGISKKNAKGWVYALRSIIQRPGQPWPDEVSPRRHLINGLKARSDVTIGNQFKAAIMEAIALKLSCEQDKIQNLERVTKEAFTWEVSLNDKKRWRFKENGDKAYDEPELHNMDKLTPFTSNGHKE